MREESEDLFENYRKLDFDIDEKYEYVPKSLIFKICSNILYYGIAFPIIKVLTKIIYDLKIEGKENIRNLQTGAISISNHVLVLDCAMIGLACGRKRVYYTAWEKQFRIPVIRKLIKLLRAIPIPKGIKNKKYFIKNLEILLKNNNIIHFYPEGYLVPYCSNLRSFKNSSFDLAVRNNVPLIPMIFTFREPKGIRKIIKKKKDATLSILKPIESNKFDGNLNEKIEKLKLEAEAEMNRKIKNKKGGIGYEKTNSR